MDTEICLSDAELKLMEILWAGGTLKAREIAERFNEETGWEKNTVYTLINRFMKKGAVERLKPDFLCTAKVKKSNIRSQQTNNLLDKLYSGSTKLFLRAFIHEQRLSKEELAKLSQIINGENRGE